MTHANASRVMATVITDCRGYLYRRTHSQHIPLRAMSKFRGKIIAMFDKDLRYSEANTNSGIHSFKSYKPATGPDSPTVDTAVDPPRLIIWGEFANKRRYRQMFDDQKAKMMVRHRQWATARRVPHLYQLYWTLTGSGTHLNIRALTITTMKNFKRDWRWISHGAPGDSRCSNILVYDFVNDYQNALIVNVNPEINIPIPDCPW